MEDRELRELFVSTLHEHYLKGPAFFPLTTDLVSIPREKCGMVICQGDDLLKLRESLAQARQGGGKKPGRPRKEEALKLMMHRAAFTDQGSASPPNESTGAETAPVTLQEGREEEKDREEEGTKRKRKPTQRLDARSKPSTATKDLSLLFLIVVAFSLVPPKQARSGGC